MKVKARIRGDNINGYNDSKSNYRHNSNFQQFVRLPRSVIRKLLMEMKHSSREGLGIGICDSGDDDDRKYGHEWKLSSIMNGDFEIMRVEDIEFLPLRIKYNDGALSESKRMRSSCSNRTVYSSYNGGISLDDVDCTRNGVIELPASLFIVDDNENDDSANQQKEGNISYLFDGNRNDLLDVEVSVMAEVENVGSVQLDPMSVKDWEILEVHADAFENGLILDQVSVIYPGQVLSIKSPTHQNEIYLRVGKIQTRSSIANSNTGSDYGCNCARLVQNTELTIKPFLREGQTSQNYIQSRPLRLIPSMDDISDDMTKIAEEVFILLDNFCTKEFNRMPYQRKDFITSNVPPFTALVHPDTINSIVSDYSVDNSYIAEVHVADEHRKCNDVTRDDSRFIPYSCCSVILRLLAADDVPSDHIALHTTLQLQLGVEPLKDHLIIHVLDRTQIKRAREKIFLNKPEFTISQVQVDKENYFNDDFYSSLPDNSRFLSIPYLGYFDNSILNEVSLSYD